MAYIRSFIFVFFAIVASYSFSAAYVAIDCIPLVKCQVLLNLIETNRDSLETINLLKTSHCGYHGKQPKVWCSQVESECKTPNGKLGHCMDLGECAPIQKLLTNNNELADVESYIKQSKCKTIRTQNIKQAVCCPSDEEIHFTTTEIVTEAVTDNTEPPTTLLPNLFNGECGHQVTSKVFGGKTTQMDEFPWTALLQYQWKSELSTNCGGTLINSRYVVTAAHCVDQSALRSVGNLVNVILGEYDTRNETDCIDNHEIKSCADKPLIVAVENIIVHPDWYKKPPSTINHDIALIRLASDVKFTDFVRPICLPTATTVFQNNMLLTVAGWGQTELANSSPVKLKTVMPVVNKDDCSQKYKTEKRLNVGDGQFCVGGENGKDSCTGDSGGPLMYASGNDGASTWFLAGVVSFGPNEPCGRKNYPGLYTHLPKYVNWILTNVQT